MIKKIIIIIFCYSINSLVNAHNLPDFTHLVQAQSPAIVNITSFSEPSQRVKGESVAGNNKSQSTYESNPVENGAGSGFILSQDGYILTNYHVVESSELVRVKLSDRRHFPAVVVGYDTESDLALLKIDAQELPIVTIGSSRALNVGQWVAAIGSPFGFEYTITVGVVSALNRSLREEGYVPFIQSDVAINPGNSGGPLFNLEGEVVGVNSQIYSETGGYMGIAFAIPIDIVMNIVTQLKSQGYVVRGKLGAKVQDLTADLATAFGMHSVKGALVTEVGSSSPSKGILKVGDIILAINSFNVRGKADLPYLVGPSVVGSKIPVKVFRKGKVVDLSLLITPRKVEHKKLDIKKPLVDDNSFNRSLGLLVSNFNNQLNKESSGVYVRAVKRGKAYRAGLRKGDIIVEVNQLPVTKTEDFVKIVDRLIQGDIVPIRILRNNKTHYLAININ